MVYAMDENWHTFAEYPCSTDFYPGYNEFGQPYCNADNGLYDSDGVYAEAPGIDNVEPPYGWAYIDLGNGRGHALHGGGSNLGADYNEPYQPLTPTLGCFRMHNADVYHLALLFLDAESKGYKPVITVTEDKNE